MAYGPIGKAVSDAMPHTEADPIGVLAGVLALYSAALNGHVFQPNGRPVVVWTALAGRSKIGRKGYALSTAEAILKSSIGDFLSVHRRQGISSGPSLVNVLAEQVDHSLTTEHGADGRVIIIEEEWQTQLKRTNRCPTFSGVFRSAWDGKPVVNTTKGKKPGERDEQRVDRPQLGFHAHIQPGSWSRFISIAEAEGGSYNRILPVMVERSKLLETMDENPLNHIPVSRALKSAYEWARKEERIMVLGQAARKRYDQLRAQYEDDLAELPEAVSCFIERSDEQVLRVAAVFTAAAKRTTISVEALEAARAFVEFSIASVKQLISNKASEAGRKFVPLDDRIRRALVTHGGEQTLSQLYRVLGSGRFTAPQIRAEVEAMPDVEVEVITDRSTDGGKRTAGSKPTVVRLIDVPEVPEAPEAVSVPAPRASEAEELLELYAAWASKPANKGKSLGDFLSSAQGQAKPVARKTPAKRAAATRKASTTASSSATRTSGTVTAKARKAPARKAPAKKTVPAQRDNASATASA
jgi:hypothetical protein